MKSLANLIYKIFMFLTRTGEKYTAPKRNSPVIISRDFESNRREEQRAAQASDLALQEFCFQPDHLEAYHIEPNRVPIDTHCGDPAVGMSSQTALEPLCKAISESRAKTLEGFCSDIPSESIQ